jgi:hypothetical protein
MPRLRGLCLSQRLHPRPGKTSREGRPIARRCHPGSKISSPPGMHRRDLRLRHFLHLRPCPRSIGTGRIIRRAGRVHRNGASRRLTLISFPRYRRSKSPGICPQIHRTTSLLSHHGPRRPRAHPTSRRCLQAEVGLADFLTTLLRNLPGPRRLHNRHKDQRHSLAVDDAWVLSLFY